MNHLSTLKKSFLLFFSHVDPMRIPNKRSSFTDFGRGVTGGSTAPVAITNLGLPIVSVINYGAIGNGTAEQRLHPVLPGRSLLKCIAPGWNTNSRSCGLY